MRKKSSHFRTSSSLNMAVRGGLTRFARPAGSLSLCSWSVQLAAPVVEPRSGLLIPPGVQYAKKKLALSYELFFEYGGEGGIDSLRSPCGQPTHCVRGLSNWLRQLSNPGRGFSSPLECNMRKKKLALSYELFFKYGGEGGIRTPDTLPYTHFPGVLLQPLGHLTKLFCYQTSWVATGRYYRELE